MVGSSVTARCYAIVASLSNQILLATSHRLFHQRQKVNVKQDSLVRRNSWTGISNPFLSAEPLKLGKWVTQQLTAVDTGPCSLTSGWLVRFAQGFPSPAASFLVSRVLPSSWAVVFLPFLHYLPFASRAIIWSHVSAPDGVLLIRGTVTSLLLPPCSKTHDGSQLLWSFNRPRATSLCRHDVRVMRLDR